GGANSAAGIEDIIQKNYVLIHNVSPQRYGFLDDRTGAHGGEVVAVKGDIQSTDGDRLLFNLLDQTGQTVGQRDATALDADQHQVFHAVIFFHDLMGQADEGTLNFRARHEAPFDVQVGESSGGRIHNHRMISEGGAMRQPRILRLISGFSQRHRQGA